MADSKSRYSAAARIFNKFTRHTSMPAAIGYLKSKLREKQYNENWKKNTVDLNDIVKRFTPGVKGEARGIKYEFENKRYIVKVDMPSGYLRIKDKIIDKYIKLDGTPGTRDETHFKIKKRKEMLK